jgi:hypothetical protein
MRKILLNIILLQWSVLYSDTTVVAFDAVHHYFGSMGNNRTVIDTIQFHDSNIEYSDIIMHLSLDCPAGGCDPWDRKAKISVKHLGEWFEIGRYVTPYGVECGWDIDVTDYRSILKGEVALRSYIDTWVQPGWLVSIEFEFITGIPGHPFTSLRNVWNYDYVTYGDPTNPVNISTITEYIPEDTEDAYLRITTTGHGQGNTDNAAEFSIKRHNILINGESSYFHNFWRDNCEFNQCSPQNGSWQYDRAGFCPGDKVTPQDFNILDYSLPGDTLQLDYILEDYFNECSPNNPSCVNGVTCSSCNYNNTGHTEPFYYIGSHLIFHTQSWHSNADAYFVIMGQDTSTGSLKIYLENYAPVYGIQFRLDLDEIEGVGLDEINFENGNGGRAEESGWTVGVNESGFVIGLAQGTGSPIPAGEGLLTEIPWNIGNFPQISGKVSIVDVQVAGYFGAEMSSETGDPYFIGPNLSTMESKRIPDTHTLYSAYPNPFNPTTRLRYELSNSEYISIIIYDLKGEYIKSLVNSIQGAGYRTIVWDATNYLGQPVSAGMYIYTIQAGEFRQTRKMVLLK